MNIRYAKINVSEDFRRYLKKEAALKGISMFELTDNIAKDNLFKPDEYEKTNKRFTFRL